MNWMRASWMPLMFITQIDLINAKAAMEPLIFQPDTEVKLTSLTQRFQDLIPVIPTNRIINKTITGIGATRTEILADRNSIIVLPNVAAIESKLSQHKNCFGLYEGVSRPSLEDYIKSNSRTAKILTTPESLGKVIDCCYSLNINPYRTYFILLDEAQKYIQDKGYRPYITEAMKYFFDFNGKAMISATPIKPSDPRFPEHGFKLVRITPAVNFSKPVELLFTNNHLQSLRDVLDRCPDDNHFIFFNSVNGIKDIIKKLNSEEAATAKESSIFCSKEAAEYLSTFERGGVKLYNAYSAFKPECVKKYNFLTSSFYNGLDIILERPPQVILLTVRNKSQTYFDPFTDSIQAIGRFRTKPNSSEAYRYKDEVVHIIDGQQVRQAKTREQVTEWFKDQKNVYDTLYTLYKSNPSYGERSIYCEMLKRLQFHKYVTDERHLSYRHEDNINTLEHIRKTYDLDYFRLDYKYEIERVNSYYADPEKLWKAYLYSGKSTNNQHGYAAFDLYLNSHNHNEYTAPNELKPLYLQGGKRYSKNNVKRIVNFLLAAESVSGTSDYDRIVNKVTDRYALVRYAYDKLGVSRIAELDFSITRIKQALIDYDVKQGKNKEPVIDSVYHKFPLHIKISCASIKEQLQAIYDHYKIPVKAKASDLHQWFELKEAKIVTYSRSASLEAEASKEGSVTIDMKLKKAGKREEQRAFVLLTWKYNLHRLLERT